MIIRAWSRDGATIPVAVRNAYRFLGLTCALTIACVLLVALFANWLPPGENMGAAIASALVFVGWLGLSFCFALAAAGWAAWGLLKHESGDVRRQAWIALILGLATAGALGAYWGALSCSTVSAPNKRVQRTRSSASPPHSPLTRHPLGAAGEIT
jgi:hypothetical protein